MKNIIVEVQRFLNGQDTYLELLYRGSHWRCSDINGYAILQIFGEDGDIIAEHRSWESVKFPDELVLERRN